MSDIALPTAVGDFIAANNAHDLDALAGVFGDGASVRDDGNTWTGDAEIRAWIRSHLIDPRIVITATSFAGDRLVASGDGDFPGAPRSFAFAFVIEDDHIMDVTIEPV